MTESQYQFEPDYQKWWDKKSVAKDDFAWVLLGVKPEAIEKAAEIKKKPEYSRSDEERIFMTRLDHFSLSNGYITLGTLAANHRALLKLEWKGKDDFIKIAYKHAHAFPPALQEFLKSVGKMPNSPELEEYKNHARYKVDLSAFAPGDLDNLKNEDEVLPYLLGLNPAFWAAFQTLDKRQEEAVLADQRMGAFNAYISFTPEEKWLFKHYPKFLNEVVPSFGGGRDAFIMISRRLRDAKCMADWKGDFSAYVQALHDNGVIFMPHIYEALKTKGINPSYSSDSWVTAFYQAQVTRGAWSLEEAHENYLGMISYNGKIFIHLGNCDIVRERGPGRFLSVHEGGVFYQVDKNGEWIKSPLHNFQEKTSLKEFITEHVQAKNLLSVDDGGLKFKPIDIVNFFHKHFINVGAQALFSALGIDSNREENLSVSASVKKLAAMAIKKAAENDGFSVMRTPCVGIATPTPIKADQETFEKYWNENTTKEIAAALVLGVHPDVMIRAEKIVADNPKDHNALFDRSTYTDDDAKFLDALHDFSTGLWEGVYDKNFILYKKMQAYWGNGRVDFVHNLYEEVHIENKTYNFMKNFNCSENNAHLYIPFIHLYIPFIEFLKTLPNEAAGKWPDKWDRYKSHDQYRADLTNFDPASVKTAAQALSIVFELDPIWHEKYIETEARRSTEGIHKGSVALADAIKNGEHCPVSREELFFLQEYEIFLTTGLFHPRGAQDARYIAAKSMCSILVDTTRIPENGGDFPSYMQAFNDAHVLFSPSVEAIIKKFSPSGLIYSEKSLVLEYYRDQLNVDKVWTLNQALSLFTGFCLLCSARKSIRLNGIQPIMRQKRSHESVVEMYQMDDPRIDAEWVYLDKKQGYKKIAELLDRHVAAPGSKIKACGEVNGEKVFVPAEIVNWIEEATHQEPVPVLRQVLQVSKTGAQKASAISMPALKKAYQAHIKENESKSIVPTWKQDQEAVTKALSGKKPTDNQIKKIRAEMAPERWKIRGRRKARS